jgi:predicted  nucleic acid-binding Zn-ribbon protein
MSEVQQLLRLQEIDSEIRQKTQRLGEVLKAQKDTEELLAARQRSSSATADLQTWQTEHKNLTLELEKLNSKAKRSEERLYSGRITNPKELTDIQNEIDSLGRRRQVMEDEVLEAMIMLEDAETELSEATDSLSLIETEWQRTQGALKVEQNELALRLNVLANQRQKQTPLIPIAALQKYETISREHGGLAVVLLRGNMCQGCRLNVSANIAKAVGQGQLIYCNQCGRILTHKW